MAYRGPIPPSSSNMMGRLVRIIKNKAPAYRDMMLDNLIGILFCHTSVLLQVETRTCIFRCACISSPMPVSQSVSQSQRWNFYEFNNPDCGNNLAIS